MTEVTLGAFAMANPVAATVGVCFVVGMFLLWMIVMVVCG